MPRIEIGKVKKYLIDHVSPAIPDWELTFEDQNHVLYGSALIKIVTKSINEMYREVPTLKQIESELLTLSAKIIDRL